MNGTTQQVKDYYKILGVSSDADKAEIRRVYRRLAKKYHPDRNKSADAEDRFKEIGEAYDVLKDEKKRAAYDQIRQGGPFHGFGANQGAWGGDGFQFDMGGAQAGEFSDLFETLFGGFARADRGARRTPPRTRGRDVEATLEVDLETAYRGGKRRLSVGGKSLDVKIPAGVLDGQKIRLKGQGDAGSGGAGDLILTISLKAHPRFRMEGRDLHLRLNLAPWEAALGATVPVDTLSGVIELKVPAGARSGQKLRARGRGMPGSPAGDLLVELMIQTPEADSESVKALYRKLKDESGFNPREG